jgi:hypothetical protein
MMRTFRTTTCCTLLLITNAFCTPDEIKQQFEQSYTTADTAWQRGDWEGVHGALAPLVAHPPLPAHWRSIAHLRKARGIIEAKQYDAARTELEAIAARQEYPQVHRDEAGSLLAEVARLQQGLPARDPEASRVRIAPAPQPARVLHVAPNAVAAGDGSGEKPFGSLQEALDAASKPENTGGGTHIILAPGTYPVSKTIALNAGHNGTAAAPVVIRAAEPGKSILHGGVKPRGFRQISDPAILNRLPEEARGKVLQCDLKAIGITDYGQLAIRGWAQGDSPPTLELFVNGKPQTLARWPNLGFVKAGKLIEPGTEQSPSSFEYLDDRHARWTTAPDGWIFGFFRHRWADCTLPIGRIDPNTRSLTTAVRYNYSMSDKEGIIYHAFNLLEEIDQPGEWYLDRNTGQLYWYPSAAPESSVIELSMLSGPMLAGENLSHIRLEGLVMDCGRFHGIEFKNSSDLLIAGCTVRRMGGNGIVVNGGFRNRIIGCDIHTIGRRGTEIIGGDRPTLTRGDHVIANCRIRDFGRLDRTYTPAVQLEGVGNRVAHCHFENAPSSAMRIEGNDHLIEYNEFRKVVLESDDQGAVDIYTSPSYRGIVFRHNAFIDIGDGAKQHAGQGGIRFDDIISGMTVYGNVFLRAGRGFGGVQMNCGKDNIIDNNLFLDCQVAVSGGYGGWNPSWEINRSPNPPKEFILNDLYRARYPDLARMYETPNLNYLWRNAIIRCGQDIAWSPETYDRVANAIRAEDPGFLNGTEFFNMPDTDLFGPLGLRTIPLQEIGLYPDAAQSGWQQEGLPDFPKQ